MQVTVDVNSSKPNSRILRIVILRWDQMSSLPSVGTNPFQNAKNPSCLISISQSIDWFSLLKIQTELLKVLKSKKVKEDKQKEKKYITDLA